MDIKEIEKLVISYVEQSIGGLEKENPKFDFKSTWYDLTSPRDINEFLKDTTAIVNTVGPQGYIVIGFDDKKKVFKPAKFKDSNLKDSSEVTNLINKKVDRLFEVNTIDLEITGNKLSIIHIPPSIDKPHVIKQYQTFDADGSVKKEDENKIFVRKNSRTFPASKYDIELMYYDRKNIIPDYQLYTNYNFQTVSFNINRDSKLILTFNLTIENVGRRPVAIPSIKFDINFGLETITFNSDTMYISNNLIIKSGEIWNGQFKFESEQPIITRDNAMRNLKQSSFNEAKENMKCSSLEIKPANGTKVYSQLEMIR
ncbi:MAG: ATP-binding protein [Cytophagales bacterium]|nr:ATP-binding protein [Cytophagales bacterium]